MTPTSFKFNIGELVYIKLGNLKGTVTGRADYDRKENQYLIHHLDAQGNPVYNWFDEQDLVQ